MLKIAQKRPFLDAKLAIERARRPATARNLFVVLRVCSPVVLSYLDAGFEARCGRKDCFIACLLLLLLLLLLHAAAAAADQDWQLGPSWVLVLVKALETTVEQSPLALQMFLHGQYDRPATWLQNGLFSPRNSPPPGTTAWHTPYSPPICISLMAQSLWKNNGPQWKQLRGRPTIFLSF